uniref:Uncharacterized protein n=1 Tax=Avena sativa TaxID=4498 RepID=A0ACD5WAS7_AVESA
MEGDPDTVAAPTSPEEEKVAGTDSGDEEVVQREEATPVVLKKGPWTTAEDAVLVNHVRQHGEGNWNAVQRLTGLLRCGKSCRLRWTNHLRPNLKKGCFSPDEELLIAQLHAQLGNKWARMASHLPGRTDNEIKNYWNTRTKWRQRAGLPMYPPEVQLHLAITKRCRHDDDFSPLSSSPQKSATDAAASAAGYTSARPPPLDLAGHGQLAMANRPVQFMAQTPFSAPSSPWAAKPFARNAHYFQFAHSSPVSPTTPTVTPELSLGSNGLHGGYLTRFTPLSLSPCARVAELPSSQLCPAAMPPSSAAVASGGQLSQGASSQDQQYADSLEAMLQELHDAIRIEPPAAHANGTVDSHANKQNHVSGGDNKSDVKLKDSIDTLFDLMTPTTFSTPEPAAPAIAPNDSAMILQHSSDEQDHSNVDLVMDNLPVIGGVRSSEQDWGLDSASCQWNNMSNIC